jgi:hypothetical protein
MRPRPAKLTPTAALATLLWAVPVLIDLSRPDAAQPDAMRRLA